MAEIVSITMPSLEEGTEAVVASWLKKPGEQVKLHEPLVEINTDKAIMEVAAPATGVLLDILKPSEEAIHPGDVLGRIQAASQAATETLRAAATPAATVAPVSPAALRELSPAVRALVQQHNLDPTQIKGSGRGGRITHEDVMLYLKSPRPTSVETPREFKGKMVPHTPMRRRIARHMVESLLKTAPHVTAVHEADLTAATAHKRANAETFQKKGVKLTYTAYFVAAAVRALQAVPEVNGRWHDEALEIFSDCNIGVATAIEGGLVVPVIYRAQTLDLFGIAQRLQELTEKARRGRIGMNEIEHGTFTITNHGVSGSLIATPIINQPQSAILGIGKLEKRLVVTEVNGVETIQIRPMAYVTITIDHRVLDGFQANSFMTKFVNSLKEW
jgi:2-oxoglutarate dehydrogenase E2 component (dihydrolipoamide succinyltransferase)